jgi:TonB family protein
MTLWLHDMRWLRRARLAARLVQVAFIYLTALAAPLFGQRPPRRCRHPATMELLPSPQAMLARPLDSTTYLECGVDQPAVLLPRRFPLYPQIFVNTGIEGLVAIEITVSATGAIDSAHVRVLRSTHDLFTRAVRAALPGWRAQPARIQGHAVRQSMRIDFRFLPDCPFPPRLIEPPFASPDLHEVDICAHY